MNELTTVVFADVSIVARYRDPAAPDIIEEQCYDISKGGMFVRSFKPLPSGTLIKFDCRVDDKPNDIQGIGRVVWQRDKDVPDAPSGMGVKFLVLRPGSSEVIERIIRKAGPMPTLDEPGQNAEQQHEQTKAQQRTSYRARTLVGDQANKPADEVIGDRSATRKQPLRTDLNAQESDVEAKKEDAKKAQTQNASQVVQAPVITVARKDNSSDQGTADDATGQQQESPSPTASVHTVEQNEVQQRRSDAELNEEKTERVLQLAARRAEELAQNEGTMANLEIAADSTNTMTAKGRRGSFGTKSLIFASVTAVILLRFGYVTYKSLENENRADQQNSIGATAQSTATQGEIERRTSQETASRALGTEQDKAIETDKGIKPQKAQPTEASALEKNKIQLGTQYEKAAACQKRGDHTCVIRLLANRVSTERESLLLAEAYRSIEAKQSELKKPNKYVHTIAPAKAWKRPEKKQVSKKTTGGIPDNPYGE